MRDEGVTLAVGVPTVWIGLLDHLDRDRRRPARAGARARRRSTCPERFIHRLEDRGWARACRRAGE